VTNAAEAEQAGLKVLVIDDSNTIRRSAEIFLRQGGHEVLLAEDGFDALAKVNELNQEAMGGLGGAFGGLLS